jgi:putative endonuclease
MDKDWYIYVLECSDGSLYCGVSTDIDRRLHEHNNTKRGAKYTKTRRPVKVVFSFLCANKKEAYQLEYKFKKLKRTKKEKIVNGEISVYEI